MSAPENPQSPDPTPPDVGPQQTPPVPGAGPGPNAPQRPGQPGQLPRPSAPAYGRPPVYPTSDTTPPPGATVPFRGMDSLRFGFSAFGANTGTFILLGLATILIPLLPGIVAAIGFSALRPVVSEQDPTLYRVPQGSTGWDDDIEGLAPAAMTGRPGVLGTGGADALAQFSAGETLVGIMALFALTTVLTGVGLYVVWVATYNAAHQVCEGNKVSFGSAFRDLPWATPLACQLILGFIAILISGASIVTGIGIITIASSNSASSNSYYDITPGSSSDVSNDEVMMLLGGLMTTLALPLLALLVGSLIFMYVLPSATSTVDTGLKPLLQAPMLLFRNFGPSFLLWLLTTFLLWLLTTLMVGFSNSIYLPVVALWLAPVAVLATTHAYRRLRGLPVAASTVPQIAPTAGPPPSGTLSR